MDLTLERLSKLFAGRLAVQIPSLTVRHGEFFTFVGPSGCGKSTTLNLIAGLETPTGGTIRLGERDLSALPPHRRNVAFVFQTYALYPHRTVSANLAFPLEMAGIPRGQIRERVRRAAEMLGLAALLEKYPRQLSGGERQRVALGRAIVREPELFLLDEPLSNLDAPLRAQMRKELKRLHQQLGCTFLYVTHDQDEALSLSDRIAVMNQGRIVQCAAPKDVYNSPADIFVARFFGAPPMNLFEAAIAPREGTFRAAVGSQEMPIESSAGMTAGPVTMGIRPEHVQVARKSSDTSWAGCITLLEPHGSLTYAEIDAGGVSLVAVVSTEEGYAKDEQIEIRFPPDRLHFFDRQSGRRLAAGNRT